MTASDTSQASADVPSLRRRIQELEQELSRLRQAQGSSTLDCAMHACACGSLGTHALLGMHGEILDASPPFLAQLGYAREDVVGRPVMDFVCPSSREQAQTMLERSLGDQPTPEIEVDLVGRTGVRTFLVAQGHVPCRMDGQLRGILVSGTDITDRKRAEEALRESEEKYWALAESIQDIVVALDDQGRYLYVNAAAARNAGGRPEDFIGKTLADVLAPPFAENSLQRVREAIASGQASSSIDHMSFRGRTRWFHRVFQPLRDGRGRTSAALLVSRDITEQKDAQEQLLQSQERLRSILSSLYETFVVVYGRDGKILSLWMPPEMRQRYGLTDRPIVGQRISDFYEPGQTRERLRRIRKVLRTGQAVRTENLCDLPNGQFVLEITLSPMRDPSGGIASVVGFVRDITESRQSQEALRASEERYRSLVENLNVGIYRNTADPEGHFLQANAALAKISGFRSVRELMKVRVRDLYERPADRQKLLDRICRDGFVRDAEVRLRGSDGSTIWASITANAVRDAAGQILWIDGAVEDVTERKDAQEALRASEERFRSLAQSARDAIVSVNSAGRIVFWNQAAQTIFGYPADEIVGKNLTRIMPARFRRIHRERIRELAASNGQIRLASTIETFALRKNKTEFPVEVSLAQWRTQEGMFFTGIIRDISDRRKAEQALRQSQEKFLSAREEERRRLASELHDCLGQGLVALHLALQGALSDSPSAPPSLAQAAQTCGELIREVRCISHGLYPPTLESLGLPSALRQLVAYCHSAKVEADLKCTGLDDDRRFGHHVEIAFFRIAQEAVQNALRHGRATRVRLDLSWHADRLDLSITDNGVGFDVKASNPGLGLLTMRDRARAVGGRLDIASRPGRTRIRLRAQTPPNDGTQ